jgi:hypothetical protein
MTGDTTDMAFTNSAVAGRPGYAWLHIDAAVAPDVTFILLCLIRPSGIYLGPNGWQGSPYEWRPLAVEGAPAGAGARLQVGPQIVDRLQPDLPVRIEIPSADYRADAHWESVPVSGTPLPDLSVDQTAAEIYEPKASEEKPGVKTGITEKPREEAKDKPGAEIVQEKPRNETSETPKAEVREKPGSETADRPKVHPRTTTSWLRSGSGPAAPASETEDGAGAKSRRLTAAAAVIAGLIAGVLVGWFYVSADLAGAVTAPPPSAASAEEAVGLLASREPQPERLYQAGIELREQPGGSRDIALQAIRRAAALGYGPARLWLAQTTDPARPDWIGARARPDAAAALEGYVAAIATGSSDAAPMLVTLCGYMRGVSQVTDAERQALTRYCH